MLAPAPSWTCQMLCETLVMTFLSGEHLMLPCACQAPRPGPLRMTVLRVLKHLGVCCSRFCWFCPAVKLLQTYCVNPSDHSDKSLVAQPPPHADGGHEASSRVWQPL